MFTRVIAALTLTLVTATPHAIAQQEPQPDPDPESVQAQVRITNPAGDPITGARIWIMEDYTNFPNPPPDLDPFWITAEVPEDGLLSLELPPIRWNILVTAGGHAPFYQRRVEFDPQEPFAVELSHGRTLRGRVVDENGQPLTNAQVVAREQNQPLAFLDELTFRAETDAEGAFEIPHLADTAYQLDGRIDDGDATRYLTPMNVRLEPYLDIEPVELVARPAAVLRGRVIPFTETRVAGRAIGIGVRLPRPVGWVVFAQPDGGFEIALPKGTRGYVRFDTHNERHVSFQINLPFRQPSFQLDQYNLLQFDEPPEQTFEGITLMLLPAGEITGVVRDEQGLPVAGADVIPRPDRLIATTDAVGRFTAKVPALQDIELDVYKSHEIKRTRTEPLRVGPGQSIYHPITVERTEGRPFGQDITGRIVNSDGEPVPEAKVYLTNDMLFIDDELVRRLRLQPNWELNRVYPHVSASDTGEFTINVIYEGVTDLWAEHPDHGRGWVRAVRSGDNNVKIVLKPQPETIRFAGTMTNADGTPVLNARLMVFDPNNRDNELALDTTSDEEGRFDLEIPPPEPGIWSHLYLFCVSSNGAVMWRIIPRMNIDDLQLQFKPTVAISGRVVNDREEPVPEAIVRIQHGRHPEFGNTGFNRILFAHGPSVQTDDDGRFTWTAVPIGAWGALEVHHPDYARGTGFHSPPTHDPPATATIDDIALRDPIIIEGTVRHADTGRPAAQAKVVIFGTTRELAEVITDDDGRYRLKYVRDSSLSLGPVPGRELMLRASTVDEEFEAQWQEEIRLQAGDHLKDIDLLLEPSFATRHQAWRSQPGDPIPTRYRIAVVEDADPVYQHKTEYHDTLTVLDHEGNALWNFTGLNLSQWASQIIVACPTDGSIWISETSGNRILKFSRDGEPLLELPDIGAYAITVEPTSGNAWVLRRLPEQQNSQLVIIATDQQHQIVDLGLNARGFVHSPTTGTIWIVSNHLLELDAGGNILRRIELSATTAAIHPHDASIWAPEFLDYYERRPSTTWIYEPDGQVRQRVRQTFSRLLFDTPRGNAWAITSDGLLRLDLAGNVIDTIPVRGRSIDIEPDTGCVWLAGQDGLYRIDPRGRCLWAKDSEEPRQKWLAVQW